MTMMLYNILDLTAIKVGEAITDNDDVKLIDGFSIWQELIN